MRLSAAALLLGSCLFLSVASHTGKILPPQNLSLTWISDFEPRLSWAPPQHSMRDCVYIVTRNSREEESRTNTWTSWAVMDGGFLTLSVSTECNRSRSEPAVRNVSNPELVKSWSCYIYSCDRSYCSWEPASNASHVRFYYILRKQGRDSDDDDDSPAIRECRSYDYHEDGTRGCAIEAGHPYRIQIVFNETRNDTRVWNTFETSLSKEVRLPPLHWTVNKTKDKFSLAWSPPDTCRGNGGFSWQYLVSYTQCEDSQTMTVGTTSVQLERLPHCPCRMNVKAVSRNGETPWGEEKRFDADADPKAAVYAAAVVVPLLFACLAALVFACCRRKKENLFPKIPQPRDLLSDIADNNKSSVCNVYVPATEEENCKITLVIDPQINKPDR